MCTHRCHKNQSPILKMEKKVFFVHSTHSSDAWFNAKKRFTHTGGSFCTVLALIEWNQHGISMRFFCICTARTSISNCQTIENLPAASVAMPKDLYLQLKRREKINHAQAESMNLIRSTEKYPSVADLRFAEFFFRSLLSIHIRSRLNFFSWYSLKTKRRILNWILYNQLLFVDSRATEKSMFMVQMDLCFNSFKLKRITLNFVKLCTDFLIIWQFYLAHLWKFLFSRFFFFEKMNPFISHRIYSRSIIQQRTDSSDKNADQK